MADETVWERVEAELGPLRLPRAYCPIEPTLKQDWFLRRDELEAFFGGAAGPGKSWGLLMASLQYVDVPGYHGLLLRPTLTEFEQPGGLIEVSHEWLAGTDAWWHGGDRSWTFPSGATIRFGYLANVNDLSRYKGPSYSFCVGRGTNIKMSDGSLRPIEEIRVGDSVMTLCGPQPVTKTHSMGIKPCATITTDDGETVVSLHHRVLTGGGWVSPSELLPTPHQTSSPTTVESPGSLREESTLLASTPSGQRQDGQPRPLREDRGALLVTDASPEDARTGCGESDGSRLEPPPPPSSSVLLVLHEPGARRDRRRSADESPRHERHRDRFSRGPEGSVSGCPTSSGCGGERPLRLSGDAATRTPLPASTEAHTRSSSSSDGPASTRSGTTRVEGMGVLRHPYTNAILDVREGVRLREARVALAGEEEVFDLTVAGSSHYITDAGIISANCGFDELTGFTYQLYRGMFRVLRQAIGVLDNVPLRMRGASNPGDIGHTWVKARFITPQTRQEDAVYVPARIQDNPHMDYDVYLKSLSHMTPLDQERLIRGDWDVMEEGGKFHREKFKIVQPSEVLPAVKAVRYWDLAGTEPNQSNADPDYTAGLRLEIDRAGTFTIRHLVHERVADHVVQDLVLQTAEADTRAVPVYIEKDPGQAGKFQVNHYKRNVLRGFVVHEGLTRMNGKNASKEVRSRPVAAAVGNDLVQIVDTCPHLLELLDECSIFPNGQNDDIVDALSGAHNALTITGTGHATISVPRGRIPNVSDRVRSTTVRQ